MKKWQKCIIGISCLASAGAYSQPQQDLWALLADMCLADAVSGQVSSITDEGVVPLYMLAALADNGPAPVLSASPDRFGARSVVLIDPLPVPAYVAPLFTGGTAAYADFSASSGMNVNGQAQGAGNYYNPISSSTLASLSGGNVTAAVAAATASTAAAVAVATAASVQQTSVPPSGAPGVQLSPYR